MRAILAIILFGAAVWRAAIDWQDTIGRGYAYRFDSIGTVVAARWPESYAALVERLRESGVPYAWDPVGEFVMSLPLALVLAALAGLVWFTRRRRRR